MPVTELALLHYKSRPSTTSSKPPVSDTTLENLTRAARKQASFSHYPVALLQCHEDPTLIYLIGGWDTVEQHMNEWVPCQANQELLKLLSTDVDVKWMFHLDMDPADVVDRLVKSRQGVSDDGKDFVVAIGRHFVKEGLREGFWATWKENVDALEDFVGGRAKREGGWRIDDGVSADDRTGDRVTEKGAVPDEFVLFTAWENVERHMDFAKTEGFMRYGKITDYLHGAEIRHGRVFCIAEP